MPQTKTTKPTSDTKVTTHEGSQTAAETVVSPNTVINLTIPWKQVKPAYDKALAHHASHVKLPGFRAGKVPAALAQSSINQDHLIEETLQKVVPALYAEEIKKADYKPITQPEVRPLEVLIGSDWKIEIHLAQKPEISIKGYEKLVKEGKAEAAKAIEAAKKAEATDKKADDKTEALKDSATTTERKAEAERDQTLQAIFKALITGLKPAIPELLLKQETRAELETLARELSQYKLTIDDYIQRRQMNFDQLSTELASTALARLQLEYVLQAIQTELKIVVNEQDHEEYFNRISDEKERATYSKNPEYIAYLDQIIGRRKLLDQLLLK